MKYYPWQYMECEIWGNYILCWEVGNIIPLIKQFENLSGMLVTSESKTTFLYIDSKKEKIFTPIIKEKKRESNFILVNEINIAIYRR